MSNQETKPSTNQTQREAVLARADELQNGQMKRGKVGDTEVVLARAGGQYYAFEGNCPHAGAPLDEGALHGTRLICAWHHACFDIKNGRNHEPPALDNIACYTVRQDSDDIVVSLEPVEQEQPQPKATPEDNRTFVILGGGAAGLNAAQKLRQEGFVGRLLMITREKDLPYDRTALSKNYMNGEMEAKDIPLRPADFYQKHNVETITQKEVQTVSAKGRLITFTDGETLSYDKLLLASGSQPIPAKIPGADLTNVFLLRSWQDCEAILEQADQAQNVVVLGASFIGIEVAASLSKRGLSSVAVVAPGNVPFEKIFGAAIGNVAKGILTEKGIRFYMGDKAARIEGNGKVETVVLESGTRLKADLVVMGLGVKPATDFLQDVPRNDNGSLNVNEYMQVSDNLYAVGDIAQFPSAQSGQPIRVEHWRVAEQHGRIAALAMLDKPEAYEGVPFFWSHPFDYPMNYLGHADHWDDIIYWGNLDERKFLAFFVQNDKVVAVFDIGYDTELAACEELLRTDKMPSPVVLRAQKPDLLGLLNHSGGKQ